MRTSKTLIRLGGCTGSSESSLGAQPFRCFVMSRLMSFTRLIFSSGRKHTNSQIWLGSQDFANVHRDDVDIANELKIGYTHER